MLLVSNMRTVHYFQAFLSCSPWKESPPACEQNDKKYLSNHVTRLSLGHPTDLLLHPDTKSACTLQMHSYLATWP